MASHPACLQECRKRIVRIHGYTKYVGAGPSASRRYAKDTWEPRGGTTWATRIRGPTYRNAIGQLVKPTWSRALERNVDLKKCERSRK